MMADAIAEDEVSPVQREPLDAAQELPLAINGVTFMAAHSLDQEYYVMWGGNQKFGIIV